MAIFCSVMSSIMKVSDISMQIKDFFAVILDFISHRLRNYMIFSDKEGKC